MKILDYPIDEQERLNWLCSEFCALLSVLAAVPLSEQAADDDVFGVSFVAGALAARAYDLIREICELRPVPAAIELRDELALSGIIEARADLARFARRMLIATKNEMYFFCAYLLSRTAEPTRSWASEHVDDAICKFLGSYIRSKTGEDVHPHRSIAEAFGVARSAGPSIWTQFSGVPYWLETGDAIANRLAEISRAGKLPGETAIVAEVANERGISTATAWRDWSTFKAAFPEAANATSWSEGFFTSLSSIWPPAAGQGVSQ